MRVAILHYHLRRGGVTRVIEMTCETLRERGIEVLMISGEASESVNIPQEQLKIVPALGYKNTFIQNDVEKLRSDLESAARDHWGELPDVWHIHNHHLAKNLEFPAVVSQWANAGYRLLLQIHDFPEDGRPENYQALLQQIAAGEKDVLDKILYPIGDHVRYGLLNSRDFQFLKNAGVEHDHLDLLPNPVVPFGKAEDSFSLDLIEAEKLILYPSRCIRRKNLGEIILWSLLIDEGTKIGCTLAPENPTARPFYDPWKEVATQVNAPVEFELATRFGASLGAMVEASSSFITTSVAEGFGLAFLEPWLANRPLVGRDIPDITEDFKQAGLNLNGMYSALNVPLEWIGRERLKTQILEKLESSFAAYSQPFSPGKVGEEIDALFENDTVDFGRLDEAMQTEVIEMAAKDKGRAEDLVPNTLPLSNNENLIKSNRDCVMNHYGLEQYGERLTKVYASLAKASTDRCKSLNPQNVLDQFLDPGRFFLLRS